MPTDADQPPGTEKSRQASADRRIWRRLLLASVILFAVGFVGLATIFAVFAWMVYSTHD